jgi:hypothetical protein
LQLPQCFGYHHDLPNLQNQGFTMGPFRSSIAALIALSAATLCSAQEIKLNVTYI